MAAGSDHLEMARQGGAATTTEVLNDNLFPLLFIIELFYLMEKLIENLRDNVLWIWLSYPKGYLVCFLLISPLNKTNQ